MQRIFLTFGKALLIFFLLSCIHSSPKHQIFTESAPSTDAIISTMHTSSDSFDIEGELVAILTCASCEGIHAKIKLDTYSS